MSDKYTLDTELLARSIDMFVERAIEDGDSIENILQTIRDDAWSTRYVVAAVLGCYQSMMTETVDWSTIGGLTLFEQLWTSISKRIHDIESMIMEGMPSVDTEAVSETQGGSS